MGLTALITSLAVGVAGSVGTGIYEAVDQPSQPQAPTAAQTAQQQAQAAQAAALAQADALSKRRGMASTILQNPVSGGTAVTQKATLGA